MNKSPKPSYLAKISYNLCFYMKISYNLTPQTRDVNKNCDTFLISHTLGETLITKTFE